MNRASCPIKTESLFPVFIQPLSSETTVSEVSPLYCSATQGRSVNVFLLNCLCSCFDFSATSRDAVGYGRGGVSEGIF